MKRMIIISIIALAVLATPALADIMLNTQINVTAGPRSGSGGAFWAEVVTGSISYDNVYIPTGASFLTFCIENNESLSLGSTYWIDIEDRARLGGSGGGTLSDSFSTYDPLDPITAALYKQWLSTADHTTNVGTADKYQLAIWKQEEEAVWVPGGSWYKGDYLTKLPDAYQDFLLDDIDNLINSVGDPSGIGSVRVMTLWDHQDKTGNKQDLIVVPTPAAVLLGILGLSVAGIKLRKFA